MAYRTFLTIKTYFTYNTVRVLFAIGISNMMVHTADSSWKLALDVLFFCSCEVPGIYSTHNAIGGRPKIETSHARGCILLCRDVSDHLGSANVGTNHLAR